MPSLKSSWSLAFALTLAPDITTPPPAAFASSSTAYDTTSQACAATSDIWGTVHSNGVGSTDLYLRNCYGCSASACIFLLLYAVASTEQFCNVMQESSPYHPAMVGSAMASVVECHAICASASRHMILCTLAQSHAGTMQASLHRCLQDKY